MNAPSDGSPPPDPSAPAGDSVRRSWLWLLLPNLVWVGGGMLFTLQLATHGMLDLADAAWLGVIDWAPWLVLSPAVLWLALRFPLGVPRGRHHLLLHLAAATLILVLTNLLAWGLLQIRPIDFPPHLGRPANENPFAADELRLFELMRLRFVAPVYLVQLLGAHLFLYYRASRERERRALLAEARLAEARLLALQAQLQPHFLFNALNAVSGLIHDQPRQADAMVCALSDLLRAVLSASGRREVPLSWELDFVDRYLAVQRIRFSDRLSVSNHTDPAALAAAVPPLLLQPLVENAIVHGLAPRAAPGSVAVFARRAGDRLVLTVTDDGVGLGPNPRPGAGTGLKNIRARLDAQYGGAAHLRVEPNPAGAGVVATVELPFREAVA